MKDRAVPGLSARAVLQNPTNHPEDQSQTEAATQPRANGPRTGLNNLPSNSMNVRFYSCGEIKVDDIGDVLEIDASGDSKLFVLAP